MSAAAPDDHVDVAKGFEFALLGPFEVRRDGAVLDLEGPQQRAVLAQLALDAGRVVAVDRLIDRLWGPEPPASALGTLQSYVSRLRRTLEPDRRAGTPTRLLVTEAPGYVLRVPRDQVDLFRFDALAEAGREAADASRPEAAVARFDAALALWRGPALAGLGAEEALGPVIARLEEERAGVVEDRFDALLALGRHAEVVGALREAVTEQPLRERLWGQWALALYRSGRQADALRALASARSTLADELGLDPGPELRRLEQQILDHDPALVATPPPAPRPLPASHAADGGGAGALVGRAREEQVLDAALARVATGRPGIVLLEGEPGIGKTALLDRLAAVAAEHGWPVARGRGVEEDLAPSLWPWVEVTRTLVAQVGDADIIDRPGVTGLVRRTDAAETTSTSIVQLAEEIAGLLVAAGRPVLVVLDDLHWADTATLEVLPLVVDALGAAPVLVAASHRPLDLGARGPLATALGAFARLPGTVRLQLNGLEVDNVAELMAAVAGHAPSADDAERVHRRTSGNPLFVAERTRLAGTAGQPADDAVPDAIRDVVRRRLARLPTQTLEVLGLAAVFGQDIDLRVLTVASRLDPDECLDVLDPAVATRVLVPSDDGDFRFGHALVREAVLVDLSPLRQARLHQRAADAIEEVFGTDRDHAEPIAVHRAEAAAIDDPLKVTVALTLAGDVARRRGALDRADELLEQALVCARRIPRGPERTDAEISALESILTVESVRSFLVTRRDEMAARIDEVAARNDSDVARMLALMTRWSVVNLGQTAASAPYAEAALELAARTEAPYLVIMGRYMAGVQAWLTGRTADACEHFALALDLRRAARREGSAARMPPINVGGLAALTFQTAGETEHVQDALEELSAWFTERANDGTSAIDVAFMVGTAAAIRGEPAAALERTALVADPGLGITIAHYLPACRVLHGWARSATRGAADAAAETADGLAELDAGLITVGVPFLRSLHAETLRRSGDLAGAEAALVEALRQARATGEVWWEADTLRLLAETRQALGAPGDDVAALAAEAVALAEARGQPPLAARARATQLELTGEAARSG